MALTDRTAHLTIRERKNGKKKEIKADFGVFCIEEFLKQEGKMPDLNSFLASVFFLPQTAKRRMCICSITNKVELFNNR